MNYLSPFTYLVSGMLSTAVANTVVTCSDIEFSVVQPPAGQTCSQYLDAFATAAQSTLSNPDATRDCQICLLSTTNQFLTQIGANYSHRWRNFGIMWIYVTFNVFAALAIYYIARVPKAKKTKESAAIDPAPFNSDEKTDT